MGRTWRLVSCQEDPFAEQVELRASIHLAFEHLYSYVESGRGDGHVSSVLATELRRWLERDGGAGGEVAGAGPTCAGGRVAADLGRSGKGATDDRRLRARAGRVPGGVRAGGRRPADGGPGARRRLRAGAGREAEP